MYLGRNYTLQEEDGSLSIERIDQELRVDVMFVKMPTDILCIPEYCNSNLCKD